VLFFFCTKVDPVNDDTWSIIPSSSPEILEMNGPGNDEEDENGIDGINGGDPNGDLNEAKLDTVETKIDHPGQAINKNNKNNQGGAGKESPWMQNMFTRIYQDLRALSKDFHVPITVPELLFFGFQSSGKTSTLSILAKTPAGTMQDGTGTRCPVRYTLTYNEDYVKPKLSVNGIEVYSFEEQTEAICRHMQGLEDNSGSKFTSDILEATIESSDVPNLIFVDMPGLIKKSNEAKYAEWKSQLEKITSQLLTTRSEDGDSFAFIPVFVREAFDVENDDGYEIETISRLCGDKRPDWRDDTLFIVNKYDLKGNRRDAQSHVQYIGDLINEGETVITVSNPGGARVQSMKVNELVEHIKAIPQKEERWWRELLSDFRRRGDPYVTSLEDAKSRFCGVGLMEQILIDKMCFIVKNTLPMLQAQLERREQEYKDYISQLQKDMDLDDPGKLRQRVSEFNHKFLEALREFYQGRDLASVRALREKWTDDMKAFHDKKYFKTIHQNAKDWDQGSIGSGFDGFYIKPPELEAILSELDRNDLVVMIRCGLIGGQAVRRALDLWTAMVSLMPFPDYTHEDILNFGDPFSGTIQGDPWIIVRNIVNHASIQLRKGCIWFGEYLRYRLKKNADIVFDRCMIDYFENPVKSFGRGHGAKFGNNDSLQNHMRVGMNIRNRNIGNLPQRNAQTNARQRVNDRNKKMRGNNQKGGKNINLDSPLIPKIKKNKTTQDMEKLLAIGLSDYKKLVDIMVNEFQEAVEVIPADQSEILNREFHEDIMNLSELLGELLEGEKDGSLVDADVAGLEKVADSKLSKHDKRIALKDTDQRKKEAIRMSHQQKNFESTSNSIQEKQMLVAGNTAKQNDTIVANNNNNAQQQTGQTGQTQQQQMNNNEINNLLEDDPFADEANDENEIKQDAIRGQPSTARRGIQTAIRTGRDHMYQREQNIRHPYTKALSESRDKKFYATLYPAYSKRKYHHMTERSTFLISKLSKVVWTCIKKHVITTAQQTLTNRVLAELKQHGERCQNALLIGIDYPHIQDLVGQLTEATKIPKADIEKMIKENTKISLNKGVGQMTNEDIRKVYGSNIEQLKKEHETMVQEYNAFLKKKEEIQTKIRELQDMDLQDGF